MLRKFFVLLLIATMTSACAQHTAFLSEPAGARVLVDGEEIGVTPCRYDYQLSPGNSHAVTIAKDGFESLSFVVITDEVDVSARNKWLTAGLVWSPLWLGTLFTKKYKDSYDFMLRESAPELTADSRHATNSTGQAF
ncbi:MAG: hypothetical protein C0614_14130 [Desulfuromonas sp.]|nr:MAG: hypothetical protein C0614_14130 [Desulfuromonas sp.]